MFQLRPLSRFGQNPVVVTVRFTALTGSRRFRCMIVDFVFVFAFACTVVVVTVLVALLRSATLLLPFGCGW